MSIKVLVVDDHSVVREGIKIILTQWPDIEVVGEAADGRVALEMARVLTPDIVTMDIALPGLNGIDVTQKLCQLLPSVKVIILSMHHTKEHVFRAVRAGAKAYILKESAGSHIVKAIREVIKGRQYYCDDIVPPAIPPAAKAKKCGQEGPIGSLSAREREVLQLVVEGKTTAEIAESLFLSPKSVATYRSRIMIKLGTPNVPSLVKFAIHHGIISL